MRIDDGALVIGDQNNKIAWKSYLKRFLSTEIHVIRIICPM